MSWSSDKVQVSQKDLDSFKEQYNKYLQNGSGIPASALIERLADAFGIKYSVEGFNSNAHKSRVVCALCGHIAGVLAASGVEGLYPFKSAEEGDKLLIVEASEEVEGKEEEKVPAEKPNSPSKVFTTSVTTKGNDGERLDRIERVLEEVLIKLAGGNSVKAPSASTRLGEARKVQDPDQVEWNKERNRNEYEVLYKLAVDDLDQEEAGAIVTKRMALLLMADQYGWKAALEGMGEEAKEKVRVSGPVIEGFEKEFERAAKAFKVNKGKDKIKPFSKNPEKQESNGWHQSQTPGNAWAQGPPRTLMSPGNQPGQWQKIPTCYYCNKQGHIAPNCFARKNATGGKGGQGQGQGFQGHCFHCGKVGHSKSNCRDFQAGKPAATPPPQGWPKYGVLPGVQGNSQAPPPQT
jgi:hypothetical protein